MPEISFGPTDGAAPVTREATTTPETQQAAAPEPLPTTTSVAKYTGGGAVTQQGFFDGGFTPAFKDIILPRLNIAQNIGEVGKTWKPGSLVWDPQNAGLCLWHPPVLEKGVVVKPSPPPVVCCVLDFLPIRYVEKVTGGGGMIVNTLDEVRNNGGTINYKEWQSKKDAGMRLFQEMADALIAIRRPDAVPDDDMVFNYPVDGFKYTLGLFAMKGSAYTAGCKGGWFVHRATGCLRLGGFPSWHYHLTTRLKEFTLSGGQPGEAWVPVPLPAFKSSEPFLAFARSLMKAPKVEAEPPTV